MIIFSSLRRRERQHYIARKVNRICPDVITKPDAGTRVTIFNETTSCWTSTPKKRPRQFPFHFEIRFSKMSLTSKFLALASTQKIGSQIFKQNGSKARPLGLANTFNALVSGCDGQVVRTAASWPWRQGFNSRKRLILFYNDTYQHTHPVAHFVWII